MIEAIPFGTLKSGETVTCYRLSGSGDAYAEVLDLGATLRAIVLPDRNGSPTDVVLGYDTPQAYLDGDKYYGALVGRHANRIGGGVFTLGGPTTAPTISTAGPMATINECIRGRSGAIPWS